MYMIRCVRSGSAVKFPCLPTGKLISAGHTVTYEGAERHVMKLSCSSEWQECWGEI